MKITVNTICMDINFKVLKVAQFVFNVNLTYEWNCRPLQQVNLNVNNYYNKQIRAYAICQFFSSYLLDY